jgi:hypothetical protein
MSIFPMESSEEFQFSDQGYQCLKYLDDAGLLRRYAYAGLTTDLNNSLYACLPKTADFVFKVCSSMPCAEPLPQGDIVLSSYIMSGEISYDPKVINLWLWSK